MYIVPHNRIAKLHEIASTPEIIIDQDEDGLNITTYPIFDSGTDEAWDYDIQLNGTGLPDHESPPGVNSNKSQNNVSRFQNGEEYELPTGLQIPDTLTIEEQEKVANFIKKYNDIFSKDDFDICCCDKILHVINTSDEIPISQPYIRIHPNVIQEVKDLISRLLKQGIIEHSVSPYDSPIVLVRKKDNSLRLCVDYRKLNAKTVRDAFPLPRIEESLEALSGAKYFSSLDQAHGYHQVLMDKGSISKLLFVHPLVCLNIRECHSG